MSALCVKCNTELNDYKPGTTVGRTATCPSCDADLHCCVQCQHYDESAYNSCKEPQAERVVEKERSNFCDYFSLGGSQSKSAGGKEDTMKKLDDLFD